MISTMFKSIDAVQFSIPEILALIGLVQCVYILVYMAFRAGGWRHAVVPFAYFLVLGAAFLSEFANRFLGQSIPHFEIISWALWFYGPPLSVLLMIQINHITEPPRRRDAWVLMMIPVAYVLSMVAMHEFDGAGHADWLTLTGLLAGVVSLFAMWAERPRLNRLQSQPGGRDRYWLILALVMTNLLFLGTMLLSLTPVLGPNPAMLIRTICGLGFVYLAGTSLFRIYPQALKLIERGARPATLSPGPDDMAIARRIESLLTLEKIYQEPDCNRVSLAKELGVSESVVSRVVNAHFNQTIPQLLNDYRVADARHFLSETDMPIKLIAEEVGFNSIASFNRVFKEIEGVTPGQFRDKIKG